MELDLGGYTLGGCNKTHCSILDKQGRDAACIYPTYLPTIFLAFPMQLICFSVCKVSYLRCTCMTVCWFSLVKVVVSRPLLSSQSSKEVASLSSPTQLLGGGGGEWGNEASKKVLAWNTFKTCIVSLDGCFLPKNVLWDSYWLLIHQRSCTANGAFSTHQYFKSDARNLNQQQWQAALAFNTLQVHTHMHIQTEHYISTWIDLH